MENEMIKCPQCGYLNAKGNKFCAECGYRFASHDNIIPITDNNITVSTRKETARPKQANITDEGLNEMVAYTENKQATVNNDGYSSIVLYKNTAKNRYELHTYSAYQPQNVLYHYAYSVDGDFVKELYQLLEKQHFSNVTLMSNSMTGGSCSLSYHTNGVIKTYSSFDTAYNLLAEVGHFMFSFVKEEMLIADYE